MKVTEGDNKLTRAEFLKMMAAGAVVGFFFKFADFSSFLKPANLQANAQQLGSWSLGPRATITPIHLVILSTGKLLYLAGSGYHESNKDGPFKAELMDPDTGDKVQYTFQDDFFCIGHNHLANGNVLLTGGTLRFDVDNPDGQFEGGPFVYEFDVHTSSFTKLQNMKQGRWYPTQVLLADGRAVIVGGLDDYGARNALVEVYDPATKTCSILYDPNPNPALQGRYCAGMAPDGTVLHKPGAGTICYGNNTNQGCAPFVSLYPRMHLMPSGLIACCGMSPDIFLLNPSTGHWTRPGATNYPWRDYGTSFLLPLQNSPTERGRILIAGGDINGIDPATNTCEIVDFNAGTNTQPVVRQTTPLRFARHYPIPIMLPDGKLIIFAGTTGPVNTNYVLTPEMWDPVTEVWTNLPDARAGRTYHGDAALLPDGRVFVASSTPDRLNWETRTEIYSPAYFFANRPTISGNVSTAPYGGTIRIPTPEAAQITAVSLVRLAANTHHFDPNMRFVWLPITSRESSAVLVSAPINGNIAPPGPYYIHVLNAARVPSKAKVIMVPGTMC